MKLELFYDLIVKYGMKLIIVVLVLFVGLFVIRNFLKVTDIIMKKNKVNAIISNFI